MFKKQNYLSTCHGMLLNMHIIHVVEGAKLIVMNTRTGFFIAVHLLSHLYTYSTLVWENISKLHHFFMLY